MRKPWVLLILLTMANCASLPLAGLDTKKENTILDEPEPNKPPVTRGAGIWNSAQELALLPMSGEAWNELERWTQMRAAPPNLADQEEQSGMIAFAKALRYARMGNDSDRSEARVLIEDSVGTECNLDLQCPGSAAASGWPCSGIGIGARSLALGRKILPYVLAADLIDLGSYDPAFDQNVFRPWLAYLLTRTNCEGNSLIDCHETRPNNWGTHCGAAREAIDLYLATDPALIDLSRALSVFKGWLGDQSVYDQFDFGDLSWQSDPIHPVAINPMGATIQGHSVDGVLPDDQRRSGGFVWPPTKENYVYEALQGALAQAVILSRTGIDVWNLSDQALLRAFRWLYDMDQFPAQGDDGWQPYIVNFYYNTSYSAPLPSTPGKNVGFTDWTHAKVWP